MVLIGQIVFAKNGRDKGSAFIVSKVEGEYVFLVNGINRTLAKPKKKKLKHIQLTNFIANDIGEKLKAGGYLLDANIRSTLASYVNRDEKISKITM